MTEQLEGLLTVAIILGAFGPLIAAVITSYSIGKRKEVKSYLKRCLDFKTNWKYYLIGTLLAFGTTVFAHYFSIIMNIDSLPSTLIPDDTGVPLIVLLIPYVLMIFLVGGGQEEFGWRGFIQEPLQNKLGIIRASFLIGLVWGIWHAPLWLIPGEGHSYYPFIAFVLFTTSWSVVIGVMYNLSGRKMIIPWVMHTMSNVSVPFFPVLFLEDVPQPGYWVWVITNLVVALVIGIWFVRKKSIV